MSNKKETESLNLPAELVSFVRDGKLLVTAIPFVGPHTKAHLIVLEDRDEIVQIIKELQDLSKSKFRKMTLSVVNSIREHLMNPLEPNQNQDLMNDLTLLFVVNALTQKDQLLEAAGLFTLALRIDPDESLPWQQRGMLDPKLLKKLKISDKPTIVS